MKKMGDGLIEEAALGAGKMDRAWMTTFWEAFSDCVIEIDAQYRVTNILRKADSTLTMADIIGRSFLDIAVDKEKEFAARELELLKTTDAPYRRFTFLSKLGRYYRWTLVSLHEDGVFLGLRGIAVDVTKESLNEITLNWQRAIIEGGSDFVSIADLEGQVLYVNPGAYKMTGYDPATDALLPERIFRPEHLATIRNEGLKQAVDRASWAGLTELIRADGTLLPIEHTMFSVRNEQGEAVFVATIIRDITDFVEHEKTMRNEQRRTELLAAVAMSFSLSDDFDANIHEALASIGSYMGVDAMCIYRDSLEQRCFVCDYLWSAGAAFDAPAGKRVSYWDADTGAYTPEHILLQGVPIFVADDTSTLEANLFARARSAGVKSMVYLPIHVDDQFWGFIALTMYTTSRIWTDGEVQFLKTICGILTTSLEKRLMSQRWQAAQSDLQAVVRNYPGIIWSLNASRRFTLYDGAFLSASPEVPAGIVGQNMQEYAREHPAVLHPSMLEKTEQTFMGEPQDWVMEMGNAVFRCNTMPILGAQGEMIGVVGASVDVTSMIQMQKDLEEARLAAEAASVAKSEFLSRMSHEIRTPMNAIIGMTQIAQNSDDEERIQNCLGKIDNASKHLLALINDILDISKIEANKLELHHEIFDLGKCIQNIRNMIAVRVEEKRQTFDLRFSESLPKCLLGDELRFTQVIINLLGNAIKFTPERGFISLDVSERGRDEEACILEVRVQDSGIGIVPEHQDKLFTPFEQGDGSITREYGGTGLGLAICKHIVELMGGGIWVESVAGEGSVFAFTVRMSIGDEKACEQIGKAKSILDVDDLKGLRVLAVDDSAETLDYLHHVLEAFSIRCDVAWGGVKAVEAVASAAKRGEPYNVIFLAYNMSDMDGISAAHRIREIAPADVAFIMTSVTDWSDLEAQARAVGITRYLEKSFTPSALLDAIRAVTGYRQCGQHDRGAAMIGADDLSMFTVLLVEDVDINREIVYAMLEDTHIHIEYAENGAKAVEMFAAAPDTYDIILMDMQMPVMDGVEATRRIRALDTRKAKDIAIVAMTANVFREDVDKCKAAGMNDHIAKPIDSNVLLEKLCDYLFMSDYRHHR